MIVTDIAMPVTSGIEATARICERTPDARVLILTQYEEQQYIAPLLRANASGFLTKRAAGTDLATAIRAVAAGEVYMHPAMGRLVAQQARAQAAPPVENLTAREKEVLTLVVRGYTNQQIAAALGLSVKTVEWHRANLMSKLDTHGVADLVRYALQHQLVEVDDATQSVEPRLGANGHHRASATARTTAKPLDIGPQPGAL